MGARDTEYSLARQQLVVYWCELNYFDFYQPVVSSETVYNNAPDLAGFVAAGGPIEDLATSVQAFEGKHHDLWMPRRADSLQCSRRNSPMTLPLSNQAYQPPSRISSL